MNRRSIGSIWSTPRNGTPSPAGVGQNQFLMKQQKLVRTTFLFRLTLEKVACLLQQRRTNKKRRLYKQQEHSSRMMTTPLKYRPWWGWGKKIITKKSNHWKTEEHATSPDPREGHVENCSWGGQTKWCSEKESRSTRIIRSEIGTSISSKKDTGNNRRRWETSNARKNRRRQEIWPHTFWDENRIMGNIEEERSTWWRSNYLPMEWSVSEQQDESGSNAESCTTMKKQKTPQIWGRRQYVLNVPKPRLRLKARSMEPRRNCDSSD